MTTADDDRAHTRKTRILIVDDHADAAEMLDVVLTSIGYHVATAFDGVQAIEVARAFDPDIALIDLDMPVRSGYDVARLLRKDHGERARTLIALTGNDLHGDRSRTRAAGFDAHLLKPIPLGELEMLLEAISGATRGLDGEIDAALDD